jgi:hypothetical protein
LQTKGHGVCFFVFDDIRHKLGNSSRQLLRRLEEQSGVSAGSKRTATKLLYIRPYTISDVLEIKPVALSNS